MAVLLILFLSTLNAQTMDTSQAHCNHATISTQKKCNGVSIAAQMIVAFAAFESHKKAKNIKEACEQAQYLSRIIMAGNYAFVTSCQSSVSACKRACRYEDSSVCDDYEERVRVATLQSIISALSYSQSKACIDAVTAKDVNEIASAPANPIGNLNVPVDAAKNFDMENKAFQFDPADTTEPYDYEGNKITSKKAKVDTPDSGATGFKSGGAASFVMAGDTLSPETERLNKDILQGTNNIPTHALVTYSKESQVPVDDTSKFDSGSDRSFNLKDFLPGGPKYKRGLANIKVEITPANGLNNFQKVTRVINDKRSELLP
jgi:hypothetical protein